MKKVLLLLFLFCSIAGSAQESIIKEFAETGVRVGWFYPICLYPSTLRMINVGQDPLYNEMVSDIEKVLVYQLDSTKVAQLKTSDWMDQYEAKGYEELITLYGKQKVKIINKEKEYVGFMSSEESSIAFYIRGSVPMEKFPSFIKSFQGDNILPVIKERFQNE